MPYQQRVKQLALSAPAEQALLMEFDALRRELDETRAAFMSLRALLVAATAPGAGYNTTATNLTGTTANSAASPPRFTKL